jgi:hypothetical protein
MHRRRRFRLGLLVVVLLGLAVAGWRWGPAGWKHAQLLYWQRQCLAYAAPGEQVVYDNDPDRAAGLLQQPGYENVAAAGAPPIAAYMPRCWAETMRIGGVPVVNTGFGPGGPGATLFLHERTSKSGVRRLVAVHAPAGTPSVANVPVMAPVIVEPGSLTTGPAVRDAAARIQLDVTFAVDPAAGPVSVLTSIPGTRFFAGRPDPNDPSHFTIPFQTHGSEGIVDGWLEDDGDGLRLSVTSTAKAPSAPPTSALATFDSPGAPPIVERTTLRRRDAGLEAYNVTGSATIDGRNVSTKGPNAGRSGKVNKAVHFDRLIFGVAREPLTRPATQPWE